MIGIMHDTIYYAPLCGLRLAASAPTARVDGVVWHPFSDAKLPSSIVVHHLIYRLGASGGYFSSVLAALRIGDEFGCGHGSCSDASR